jgi:benzoylformate decarboxylase
VCGDPRLTLEALLPYVEARADPAAAAEAAAAGAERRREQIDQHEATALDRYGPAPMDPMAVSHALVRSMPSDTIVVDEAITTGGYVRGFHHWTEPGRYYFCKGGGLGWGMPAALGVSLAHDAAAPVLCVVGDGSAMYSPQALWTAAHEGLPVIFAVVNNRQYLILKTNLRGMKGDTVATGRFVAMDIVDPPVDYVSLAASLGVPGARIDHAGDVGDAVRTARDSGGPYLLELPIAAPE